MNKIEFKLKEEKKNIVQNFLKKKNEMYLC